MSHHGLHVENLAAAWDGHDLVVRDINLDIEEGAIGCLLGASGCGKTCLLRCVAGLQEIRDGLIQLDDRVLSDRYSHIPPEQRGISMVFQDYALFPHLTVEENIGFGIRALPGPKRRRRINEMLKLIDMQSFHRRYPHELSGGQQQRVALARAIATAPRLLLLDEPFSSLDSNLRPVLAAEVKELVNKAGTTTLIVTHDQHEALTMADALGVMQDGKLLQWDSAYNIYHRPISHAVASFVGLGNFIKGRVIEGNRVVSVLGTFTAGSHFNIGELVDILVRPDDIIHDDDSRMQATVIKKQFRGSDFLYQLGLSNGESVHCFAPSHHNHSVGCAIGIVIDVQHIVVFKSQDGNPASAIA